MEPTTQEVRESLAKEAQDLASQVHEVIDMQTQLGIPKDAPPPDWLVEGAICEAICDITMSMDALKEYEPNEVFTRVQSAQGTCRVVAHQTQLLLHLMGKHKMTDTRHSYSRRLVTTVQKRLLEFEPCDPSVISETDYRICESIKDICLFLSALDIVMLPTTKRNDRSAAAKAYLEGRTYEITD